MQTAGGILMGKLTAYEVAHGGPSWDLPGPPAMNPWKRGYLPGSTGSGPGSADASGLFSPPFCSRPTWSFSAAASTTGDIGGYRSLRWEGTPRRPRDLSDPALLKLSA